MNSKPTLAGLPSKKRQDPKSPIAAVRYGDGCITAGFPPYSPSRPKPQRTERGDNHTG